MVVCLTNESCQLNLSHQIHYSLKFYFYLGGVLVIDEIVPNSITAVSEGFFTPQHEGRKLHSIPHHS